jgi:hypothetical protein
MTSYDHVSNNSKKLTIKQQDYETIDIGSNCTETTGSVVAKPDSYDNQVMTCRICTGTISYLLTN